MKNLKISFKAAKIGGILYLIPALRLTYWQYAPLDGFAIELSFFNFAAGINFRIVNHEIY